MLKHNMCNTRLYSIWENMKARCNNPNHISYSYCGDRGIKVCSEWYNFVPFMQWALANGYSEKLTLDRKDNDKGYCPDNCRWVTTKEQANNTQRIVWIEIDGITDTFSGWSERTGLSLRLLRFRYYNYGWRDKRLIKPNRKKVEEFCQH